jgi:hypothetical protein
MATLRCPSLYQINTRVWLAELSRKSGRAATLDDVPDAGLDRLVELGFDRVWFLSVWQTGPAALARVRRRMRKRGLKLMLDFVPNHTAPDHPWVDEHPEFFVHGGEADMARSPRNYRRGERVLVAANYAPHQSQCCVDLPFPEIKNRTVRFEDALGPARYVRDGNELLGRGFYLDMQPWSCHVLDLEVNQ